jgi:hypothetical protein
MGGFVYMSNLSENYFMKNKKLKEARKISTRNKIIS